ADLSSVKVLTKDPGTGADTVTPFVPASGGGTLAVYETEAAWAEASTKNPKEKEVEAGTMVFIKETGDLILADDLAASFKSADARISVDYRRDGFSTGELRPEYYYNCKNVSDADSSKHIAYEKYEVDTNGFIALYDNGYPKEIGYDIEYAIAFRQNLSVNLEANDVFDMDIYQDMSDMISAVDSSIKAHDKVTEIEKMMNMEMYQGTYTDTSVTPSVERNYQDTLTQWKAQAQKEADYYDDNLQKLFSRYIGKADDYLEEMSLALTKVGCKADQLAMTQDRMNDQQETVQELQSRNDDMNLSDIILKYTAAYTAYQSSLTAAGKLGSVSLLNYI
ncbi:MAG: hypothetical protein K6A69_01495, partial [Lachnospiraceae bacterium]|nr:hypothetical protein [Lachnospiraceae bacterium]